MRVILILLFCGILSAITADAQTVLTKDAMNSFAKYSTSNDIKDLENARKLIDDAYKTASDSTAFKNNMIRALVYSTLANVDSNRSLKYSKDPVAEAKLALVKVYESKSAEDAYLEIKYVNDQLEQVYLYRGNKAFNERQFSEALKYYSKLDSIDNTNVNLIHNLAILHQEVGNYHESVTYYEKLLAERPRPEYFLVLSGLYQSLGDESSTIKILRNGSELYPSNRDLVFKLLNLLLDRADYTEIAKFSERALKIEPQNINLNYLAGFSNEMTGNHVKAEEYYKAVLNINPNNYEGNYALGLLYLTLYLKDPMLKNLMYVAKYHLSKANEIDPNELKSLTSLSILYKHTGETNELQKINNRINQLKLN